MKSDEEITEYDTVDSKIKVKGIKSSSESFTKNYDTGKWEKDNTKFNYSITQIPKTNSPNQDIFDQINNLSSSPEKITDDKINAIRDLTRSKGLNIQTLGAGVIDSEKDKDNKDKKTVK